MIEINNGILKINDSLKFYPGFHFKDFKKTKYYKGESGIRVIYLDEKQVIDQGNYIVSFFFRNNIIYMVSLINCDKEIL